MSASIGFHWRSPSSLQARTVEAAQRPSLGTTIFRSRRTSSDEAVAECAALGFQAVILSLNCSPLVLQ